MMAANITNWNTIDDLIAFVKDYSNTISANTTEIERKWLVDYKLIDYLKENYQMKEHLHILQGYLSVDPEVRYRGVKSMLNDSDSIHYLAYKSNGDLEREEYEVEIDMSSALKLAKTIREREDVYPYKRNSKFINKDYYVFDIGNGISLELSMVDDNRHFTYLEIEFKNIDDANRFTFPGDIYYYIKEEVTYDKKYKMKNYWARTRLNKK